MELEFKSEKQILSGHSIDYRRFFAFFHYRSEMVKLFDFKLSTKSELPAESKDHWMRLHKWKLQADYNIYRSMKKETLWNEYGAIILTA